ncbi:SDR family NAD(P)-dependent oxidoreductase [Botrimarina mediterranea]|uniref:SDR family NAD(P)-dependent oxidoreductase n=1 Tax=Botrimarina mediterranea TaxID=2528022 RepID=UPI00118A305B|nr:Gluconate 5-dehydrogenase [Planctomycetes bacterium K2D]
MPTPSDQPETCRHALVTGASAGLGLAIAHAAARAGMAVTLVARDVGRLEAAYDRLTTLYPGQVAGRHSADLSEAGAPTHVVREAQRDAPLDFVCHAAGLSTRGRIVETPRSEFERLMAINFFAAAELATALGEPFAERGGRLVLIGSLATRVAPAYLGAYPASKHPLSALAQQLRMELGPVGLKPLLVMPGPLARKDGGTRYDTQAEGLPEAARRPGGGAKVKAIDPDWLADRIVQAAIAGKSELIVPAKARLLFALSQLSPALGDWLLRRYMRV